MRNCLTAGHQPQHSVRHLQHQLRLLRPRPLHCDVHRQRLRLRFPVRRRPALQPFHVRRPFGARDLPAEKRLRLRRLLGLIRQGPVALHLRIHSQSSLGRPIPQHLRGVGHHRSRPSLKLNYFFIIISNFYSLYILNAGGGARPFL